MYDLTASDVYQKRKKNSKLPDNGNFATVSCNIRTLLSRNSKLDSAFEERKERNNENSTINSKDIIEHTSKKITRMINISIFPPPYYEKQFPKAKNTIRYLSQWGAKRHSQDHFNYIQDFLKSRFIPFFQK